MLKSVWNPTLIAALSCTFFACQKSSSNTQSISGQSYVPSEAEQALLAKGVDEEQPDLEKSVCIQTPTSGFEKVDADTAIVHARVVKNIDEVARDVEADLSGPEPKAFNAAYFSDTSGNSYRFAKSLQLDPAHVYFLWTEIIHSYFIHSDNESVSEDALKSVNTPAFRANCGTHFVQGLGYGGHIIVLFDFKVPADKTIEQYRLDVQQNFFNNTMPEVFAANPPRTQIFQKGGPALAVDASPEQIWTLAQNFSIEVEQAPTQLGKSYKAYDLLDNYPWE